MLKTRRAIYEGGVVRPLEPIELTGRHEVMITFLNGGQPSKEACVVAAGSWQDLDTEALKRQLYEQRSISQRPQRRL